jgi:hypothetical protein
LADGGLSGLVDSVGAGLPVGDHARAVTFALARRLSEARDWSIKLSSAADLHTDDLDDTAVTWLDELLAEIIDGNAPIKAALGYAPNLATALEAMLAVVAGSWDSRLPGTPPLQRLSDIMARRPMPRVREALLHRICGALGGRAPLTKLERADNAEALRRLLPKLREFGGFMGGVAMAAALTRRAKVDFGSSREDLSLEMAVATLTGVLPNPAGKIGYLLDLLGSELGRSRAAYLTQQIAELFSGLRSIREFAPEVDSSWSQDMIREDFRRRLYRAGIPRRLADGLLQKLEAFHGSRSAGGAAGQALAAVDSAGPVPHRTVTVSGADCGQLRLTYRGVRYLIVPSETPFTIGRGDGCRLVVDWAGASRAHAVIKVEGDDFILLDQSKNGTIVHTESHRTITLSKSSTVLTGKGSIAISAVGDDADARERAVIEFQRLGPN